MNNFPKPLIPRAMEPEVINALKKFPVVIVTGARQTGKSTLITIPSISKNRTFRTLDDYDVLDRAEREPDSLISEGKTLTLDEIQRAPRLLLEIKRDVDQNRKAGRFLLTGPANLLMMRKVSESLSGRAIYLQLWPMTVSEKEGHPRPWSWGSLLKAKDVNEALKKIAPSTPNLSSLIESILVGGYPISVLSKNHDERTSWFESYIRTYLERDLQEIAAIQRRRFKATYNSSLPQSF